MSKLSRILTALAAVALLGAFVWPLWTIGLVAPQYPEGLGMQIRLTTVAGVGEHDLENINELNHYIGMHTIEPEEIPELRYMPVAVGLLSAFGLVAAAAGRRKLLFAWVGILIAASVAGLADFWRWTYNYGHHLDFEHAIIKIPGTAYQPPLLGVKQILNFTATLWPGVGGLAVMLGVALACGALFIASRSTAPRMVKAA